MTILPPSHWNRQVPADIDNVVMTALQRDPDRRWQHATALRTAMTTLTQRHHMVVTNREVVQWLDTMDFEAETLTFEKAAAGSMGDSVVISIEQPQTMHLAHSPLSMPVGTPARPITAQPNVPTLEMNMGGNSEYAAAVQQYETHGAPTVMRPPPPAPLPPVATLVLPAALANPPRPRPSRLMPVLFVILAVAGLGTTLYFLLR